jgi:hypothetical protein
MPINRQVMKFLVPKTLQDLGTRGRSTRAEVPFYINPQDVNIQEKKMINSTLTKGGYSIQYWGEELTRITVMGTTGSGGIEAINILRSVYRNEIDVFNNILKQRAENMQQDFISAFGSVPGAEGNVLNRTANFGDGLRAIADDVSRNGVSSIGFGTISIIDAVADAARGIADLNPASVELVPTMGAFATSLILYWHGEMYQGYIENFNSKENAASPGHFDYDFSFTCIKRSGTRKNFMPWHRNPYDSSKNYISASLPKEGAMPEELSIPLTTQNAISSNFQNNRSDAGQNKNNSITSNFRTDQNSQVDRNNVGINRRSSTRGS